MLGTFRQNHSSQLQIEALKPSKGDSPRDKADANLGKALHKSTQTGSNQHLQKPTQFTQNTENGATSPNTLLYRILPDNGLSFIRS